jgi:hypothetical protein
MYSVPLRRPQRLRGPQYIVFSPVIHDRTVRCSR